MKRTALQRWFQYVHIPSGDPDACWTWTGAQNGRPGYGRFRVGNYLVSAHRFAYTQFVGAIPEGLTLDHLCRNRLCVNPAHLEACTQRENLLRGDTFIAANARKTHCVQGHAFDKANTAIRRGRRACRACDRHRKRRKHWGVIVQANAILVREAA